MRPEPVRHFRIAGRVVATDSAPPELAPFEIEPVEAGPAAGAAPVPSSGAKAGRLVFHGAGWVVDRRRPVECRIDERAYRLEIGGVGSLWVALDGRSLGCSRCAAGADSRLVQLALLGPALSVALALQGTFCLHASAVEAESRILAFAGESGSGKSTLAGCLSGLPALGWRRAGDDILPLHLASGRPRARTDFPQLKLTAAEQPCAQGQRSLPVGAVFLLHSSSADRLRAAVRVEPLGAMDSVLALVRHTVAARMFGADLLQRHLQFCAAVGARVPVRRLSYPWQPEAVPRVAAAITPELE
jgi:hypothetical protein